MLAPLHSLVASAKTPKTALHYTSEQNKAFLRARASLYSATQLVHPSADPEVAISLTTDASVVAVGAVLSQGEDEPLAFYSKKLSPAQQKLSLIHI